MAKKQILSQSDIQRDLLTKINKRKSSSVFATIIILLGIPAYICLVINYKEILARGNWGHVRYSLPPTVALYVMPFVFLILIIYFLNFYYIDLYKAKKGKFIIVEEKLYERKKEMISYYRCSAQENSLYFRSGRVAVEDDVYSYSTEGDRFYVIVLRSKKDPLLVYHAKYYEINDN